MNGMYNSATIAVILSSLLPLDRAPSVEDPAPGKAQSEAVEVSPASNARRTRRTAEARASRHAGETGAAQ